MPPFAITLIPRIAGSKTISKKENRKIMPGTQCIKTQPACVLRPTGLLFHHHLRCIAIAGSRCINKIDPSRSL